MDDLKQAAGFGVGTLAALTSIKGGGLANYMMNRGRLLSDPQFRATLVDSPFTSGFFGITQGGPPTGGAPPVAQPGEGTPAPSGIAAPQDTRYLPAGGRSYPNLPPLDYTSQVKAEQDRATMIGLTSADPAIRTQSKLAVGVPLSNEEISQAVGAGRGIVTAAGPGSQVQYKLPGGAVTIGSPYIAGNYLSQAAADEYARKTGKVVVPSPSGGYTVVEPERPALGEYTNPGDAEKARQPGEVTKPTGRTVNGVPTYQNVKEEPAGVAPLRAGPPPRTPAPAPVQKPTPAVQPPAQPPARPAAPAAQPPAPAPEQPPAPPPAQPPARPPVERQAAPPPPPPPPPHEVVRQLPDGSFAPVKPAAPPAPPPAPPPKPRAEAAPMTAPPMLAAAGPASPLLFAAAPPVAPPYRPGVQPAPAPAPVMVARAEPPPYQVVSGAELGGIASGAPPVPAEQALPAVPASAVPWTPTPAGQPAVQAEPAPRGMPAGTQTFSQSQPIKPELGGGTVSTSGETPGKTEADLDKARRLKEIDLDTQRRFGDVPERKELNNFYLVRSYQNELLTEYTPEERASYVGYVTPWLRQTFSSDDPRYQRFLDLNAQIHAALGGEKEETKAPLPTGTERTPAQYESALRSSVDRVDKMIGAQSALANMHVADLTPAQQQKFINERLTGKTTVRFGPYPWDEKTGEPIPSAETPTSPPPPTTTSPFVVDRLYQVAPAR